MKFILDGENLTLALSAKESVWALRRNICIPVTSITNIEWVASTVNTGRLHGLRAPGTGLPGVFYAGSFYRKVSVQPPYSTVVADLPPSDE